MKHSWQPSRRYKFLLRLGFAIAFLVLILLGYTLSRPVTLTFMVPASEFKAAPWLSLIEEFQEQNRDIKIRLKKGSNNSGELQKLNASALRSGYYDLAYMDIIWVPKFAKAGLLRDLSDRISNEELAKFLPSDVDGGRYEGKLYRIPLRSDVGMLYYRKDLLEEPPETFEQLLQMARTLQKQRAVPWGYVWPGQQYEGLVATFVEILQGYGGFWINSITREVGLDHPEAVEVVEFLRGTIEQGISPTAVTGYQEEQAHNLFLQGKAVFLRDWPNVWALAKDSPVRGKIAIKPMVHAPGNSSGACKGGWGFGIAAKTRHPEAAWKAIKFFTSAAAERQLVLETGYLPSRRSLFIDPQIVGRYSHFPKLLEVIENSVLRPLIPQYDQASEILQRYLSDALTGRLSPKEAMEAAAKQTRQLMEKG